MKRLFLVATLAIMAVGCQKTEVNNETNIPIGFSTEVGKQTRAIVNDASYLDAQPFGVFAYGYNGNVKNTDPVMDHVEVAKNSGTWKANDGYTYYWPNDPTTTINFYAYSPVLASVSKESPALKEHQVMNGQFRHDPTSGLSITEYTHSNMYVDFMVSDPVEAATYNNPDGDLSTETISGKEGEVPIKFNHQMTQVVFEVTTDEAYPGITFTIESITLKNIKKVANYNSKNNPKWTNHTNLGAYQIFPANTDNGAVSTNAKIDTDDPATTTIDETKVETAIALNNDGAAVGATTFATMTTTGVTMIPQTMVKTSIDPVMGEDSYKNETNAQMFEIVYSIEGDRVPEEKVTKHVPFKISDAEVVDWTENKKITYKVQIGMNEITFAPTVVSWTDTDSGDIAI